MAAWWDQDLLMVRAAAYELKEYLLGRTLYWPLYGAKAPDGLPSRIQRLTPGTLMFSQRRLLAAPLPAAEQAQAAAWNETVAATREAWKSHWMQKSTQEFAARLRLWQAELQEFLAEPPRSPKAYAFAAQWRCLLDLLAEEIPADTPNLTVLTGLDHRLRLAGQPSAFVWDAALQPAFDPQRFWYLYFQLHQAAKPS